MLSLFRLSPPSPDTRARLQRDSIPFVLAEGRRIDVLRVLHQSSDLPRHLT